MRRRWVSFFATARPGRSSPCCATNAPRDTCELRLGQGVGELECADGMYRVRCGDEVATAPALVIATGGPSIPKMGATGFAYDLARKFGLEVVAPRPALVPLTLGKDEALFQSLSGVATDVVARCGER